MVTKKYVGLVIIILSAIFILNPMILISIFDNKQQTYNLNISDGLGDSLYNYTFTFDKAFISTCSEDYSNSKNLCYLNIFIDEFANNNSIKTIQSIKLNKNIYYPINNSYEYSLNIDLDTINLNNQNLVINKTSNLAITSAQLTYKGVNYANDEVYANINFVLFILLFFIGLFLLMFA
jgi:hypothetical protein